MLTILSLLAIGVMFPQSATDSAGFVTRLGRDTVAIESFRRSPSRLEGQIVLRVPNTVTFTYRIDLTSKGLPTKAVLALKPESAGDVVKRRTVLEFRGDSVRMQLDSADSRDIVTRAAPHGMMPFLVTGFGSSYGLYFSIGMCELLLDRFKSQDQDSVALPIVIPLTGRTGTRQIVRRSASVIDVDFFRIAWTHLAVDREGRIQRVDASETTEKTLATRELPINVAARAKEFAARDASRSGLGVASPRDSVRAVIGGVVLGIDYSSPRARGRKILGTTIPFNVVWRTGANAATVLRTTGELLVGGQRLPAGRYSLWTRPTISGVELIINSQSGQWGTDYDAAKDVLRVPMNIASTPSVRENFRISVVSADDQGELEIAWDSFRWHVLLQVP